jgi:hypothetical protein
MPVEQSEPGLVPERPYEVFGEHLASVSGALSAVRYLTRLDAKAMQPVLLQILNTRFPLDAYALEELGRFIYLEEDHPGTDDRLIIVQFEFVATD